MGMNRREIIKGSLAVAVRTALYGGTAGIAVSVASCGGGGGTTSDVTAPSGLSYATPVQATVGTEATPLTPTVTGSVTSYSVSPPLPAGISLNTTSGVISGTPSAAAAQATYTITAINEGGSTSFALLLTVNPALAISSLSSESPTALTALYISTTGLDVSSPFTVTLTNTTGTGSVTLPPLRTESSGTIVVATPLTIDNSTGSTTPFVGSLTVSQNNNTSVPVSLSISDLPQLSDLGVPLGTISRAFHVHHELAAAGNLNAQQALSLVPNISMPASNLTADLSLQLKNTILARNDVDRLIADNSTIIPVATAPDGTPINYTSASLELQDRILGQYLLSFTNNGMSIPQHVRRTRAAIRARPLVVNYPTSLAVAQVRASARSVGQFHDSPAGLSIPPGAITTLTQAMTAAGGWVGVKTSQQTLANTDSAVDGFLASISLYQTVAVVGTTAVALGAAAVGAPTVAALAGGLLTYELLAGVMIGAASVGNDLYNVAVTGYDAYQASGDDQAANSRFAAAGLALATDSFTTAVNSLGVGAFASGTSIVGNAATTVFEGLWGSVSASDAGWQAAGLASSTANLFLQKQLSTDSNATDNGLSQLSTLSPSAQVGIGSVDGMMNITNTNGPILSGLTGVQISDGTNSFSGIGDLSGDYTLLVPIGSSAVDYSQMTLSAYDPSLGTVLASELINLSSLTSTSASNAPPVSGTCVDSDADDPDGDDPDCDSGG